MKKIVQFAVKNPVTMLMVVLAILLLGKISYDQLSVDLMPNLNNPRLFVEIKAGERPPEEIEKLFIKNMESNAIRQRDVVRVSSVVKAGSARMTVEYTWKKDMDEAFLDLQKAMNSFSQNENLTELLITQNDPNTNATMLIGLSHPNIKDMNELRKIAESYVRNELVRVEGVADVTLSGQENSILAIKTDPYKLKAFNLTIENISAKIKENNQDLTGGKVTELGLQYIVKGASVLSTVPDFEKLIIGYKAIDANSGTSTAEAGAVATSENKAPIYLKDLATVTLENDRPENLVRINGERSIGLSVYKEMRYNTVKMVDNVNGALAKMVKALPGYQFSVVSNQGTFIKSAIGEVKDSAIMGILLAIVILYLFLRRIGTTLIVSLAIPISIVATFNLMYFNHLTLNIMTLGGLALGAGMLVDNAIVVIESIFQNQERGLSVREACINGTSEVAAAVSASTLTTIVVFLPIVYLQGATGELFKDQAWTVSFSLISSLFVAILIIPTLYDRVFGGKREKNTKPVKSVQIKAYGPFLRKVLQVRWLVIGLGIALVGMGAVILPFVGTEFMPRSESRSFSVNIKMPEGTRLERTTGTVESLENILTEIVGDSSVTIYSHVGAGGSSDNAIFEGENTAEIKVILSNESAKTQDNIIAEFTQATDGMKDVEITFKQEATSLSNLLGSESSPIVVEVKGEELDELAELTKEVKDKMMQIPSLANIVSTVENGAPEITIVVDRTIAGMNEISVSTIINQVKQQLEGGEAGQMEYRGDMCDILIKMPQTNLASLGNLTIKNGQQEYLLREIAKIEQSVAPKEIFRRNQNRINKILADISSDTPLDKVAEQIRTSVAGIDLPKDYTITVTGEEEQRKESMGSLMFALVLSVVLVYMVMASQFESLLHPFTILLTIPLAVVGAILLFWITGTTINIMGVIGIVMLGGIAVNNSIILVDRITQIKESGVELTDAIVQAGQQRIRPIIMTTLTTILALLPMTFGFGDGASLRSPMAIAVIGGLVTSTILSLIVIPCVYMVLEQAKMAIDNRHKGKAE